MGLFENKEYFERLPDENKLEANVAMNDLKNEPLNEPLASDTNDKTGAECDDFLIDTASPLKACIGKSSRDDLKIGNSSDFNVQHCEFNKIKGEVLAIDYKTNEITRDTIHAVTARVENTSFKFIKNYNKIIITFLYGLLVGQSTDLLIYNFQFSSGMVGNYPLLFFMLTGIVLFPFMVYSLWELSATKTLIAFIGYFVFNFALCAYFIFHLKYNKTNDNTTQFDYKFEINFSIYMLVHSIIIIWFNCGVFNNKSKTLCCFKRLNYY